MKEFLEKNITLKNMFIGILILIICFMKFCECETIIKADKNKSDTITIIKTKVDTIVKSIKSYVPVPVTTTKIDTHHHWHTDMSACQYINYYSDTIADSNLQIVIKDTIQGWLRSRKVDYQVYQKTITITNTIKQMPKYSVYLGAEVGGNKSQFNFSPFIAVRKDGTIVSLKHNLIDKTISIGLGIKILQK